MSKYYECFRRGSFWAFLSAGFGWMLILMIISTILLIVIEIVVPALVKFIKFIVSKIQDVYYDKDIQRKRDNERLHDDIERTIAEINEIKDTLNDV